MRLMSNARTIVTKSLVELRPVGGCLQTPSVGFRLR